MKQLFAVIYISSSMGLLANILIPYPSINNEDDTSRLFVLAWLALYAITCLLLLLRPGAVFKRMNILATSLFLLVLCSIFSSLWSNDAFNSLSYAGVLALNLLFCFWIVNEYSYSHVVSIIYRSVFIMVVCSVLLYIVGYDGVIYYDPHGRDTILGTQPLRGLFNHKITAGLYAVFGLLLCVALKKGVVRLASSFIFILFTLLSGSSAAIGLLVISVVIYSCIQSMLYHRFSLGVFIAIVLFVPLSAVLTFILVGDEVLAALGRDPTLTGRTLLWGWGVDVALQKPWVGWGYQGYMGSEHAKDYAQTIPQFVNYNVPHFHNAYIQLLVELGLLGFSLYFVIYFTVVARLYTLSYSSKFKEFRPLLASLVLLLVSSFFINTFFQYNDFSTILFFISAVIVSKVYDLRHAMPDSYN